MIDVQVEFVALDGSPAPEVPPDAARWVEVARAAAEATLASRGVEEAEVSLTLLPDAAIRSLNREHLEHDRPTDVLSFALYGDGEPVLADVYVGWEQAVRQAAREGISSMQEIARLAVHGTLHVLGFDHPDEAEARPASEMYRIQESIVAGLDIPSPHRAAADAAGHTGGAG